MHKKGISQQWEAITKRRLTVTPFPPDHPLVGLVRGEDLRQEAGEELHLDLHEQLIHDEVADELGGVDHRSLEDGAWLLRTCKDTSSLSNVLSGHTAFLDASLR